MELDLKLHALPTTTSSNKAQIKDNKICIKIEIKQLEGINKAETPLVPYILVPIFISTVNHSSDPKIIDLIVLYLVFILIFVFSCLYHILL